MINTIQVTITSEHHYIKLKHISGFRNNFTWVKYQLFPYSIYKDWCAYITNGNSILIYDNSNRDVGDKFIGTTIILGEFSCDTIKEKQLFKWEKQINDYLNNIDNET